MGPPTSTSRRGAPGGPTSRRTKKSSKVCCKLSLNSLWSIWYCILVVTLQTYIIVSSVRTFGKYISLPWPLQDQPYLELNAYIGFLGASVVLMPFFVTTAIFKIGNYSNDGKKLSSLSTVKAEYAVYENIHAKRKNDKLTKVIWRHGVPMSAFLHVISGFCLLLPKIFIEAQLAKHGFINKSGIWNSELDFVVARKDRLVSISFLSTVNVSEIIAFGEEKFASNKQDLPTDLADPVSSISAEFINFGISLLVYAIQYPAVLWDLSKPLAFLFSIQLICNGVQQLLAFAGFSILYKVQIYGPSSVLIRFNQPLLNATTTVLLFFLYNVAVTVTSCTVYAYAVQKYHEWIDRQLRRHHVIWVKQRWRLWGYMPHVSAFVTLVVLASSATPIAYDLTLVYCGSLDGVVLVSVTSMVVHVLSWITLWLVLTVKQRWKFEGRAMNRESKKVPKSYSDSRTHNGHISKGDDDLALLRGAKHDVPLLVIDNNQTYQIRDKSCKKVIVNFANQSLSRQTNSSSTDEEDIYWLKPNATTPKAIEDSTNEIDSIQSWSAPLKKSTYGTKQHKVTFDESLSCSSRIRSPKKEISRNIKSHVKMDDFLDAGSDEGDYATVLKMPETGNSDSKTYRHPCPCEIGDKSNKMSTSQQQAAILSLGVKGNESMSLKPLTYAATLDSSFSPSSSKAFGSSSGTRGFNEESLHSKTLNTSEKMSWRHIPIYERVAKNAEFPTPDIVPPSVLIRRNPSSSDADQASTYASPVKLTTFFDKAGISKMESGQETE